MKTFPSLQKIIAAIMIFIIMTEFTGCYSSRMITTSDIQPAEICYIHGYKAHYHVSDPVISNGVFSGTMSTFKRTSSKVNRNHLYISNDSIINIDKNILTLPVSGITNVEQKVFDKKKTTILCVVLGASAIGVVVLDIILINSMIKSSEEVAQGTGDLLNYCFTSY